MAKVLSTAELEALNQPLIKIENEGGFYLTTPQAIIALLNDTLSAFGLQSPKAVFRSNPVVYVNDSQVNFAHGWSNFDPATDAYLEQLYAICTTADDGYVVGDVVSLKTRRGTTKITNTHFVVLVEDTGFRYTRATNQTEGNMDANNWEIFVVGVWL